jgi:hypothetical protein
MNRIERASDAALDPDTAGCECDLTPWNGRFFAELESAKPARFYRRVGTIGRLFMEIETQAFALPS